MTQTSHTTTPSSTSPREWLALLALALAMLTVGLDMTVLNVALPTLAEDLHANTATLQWFTAAYTLALSAVMLPAGALGDRFGRTKFLVGALLLFGAASAVCASAGSSAELIAARVVLGCAAAVLTALSFSVIPVMFPPEARGRATTVFATATGLGMPLGPIVGGWLLQHFWWGSVFWINVPVTILGAAAVGFLVPESRSETFRTIDLPGVALSAIGLVGLTYGFIRAGSEGWRDGAVWATIAVAVVMLGAFLTWQRAARHPLIDLGLFRNAEFRWGVIYSVITAFAMFGMFFTVPQYFQAVLGVGTLGSGLRLLPMIAGMMAGVRVVDRISERLGTQRVLLIGFGLLAIGLGLGAMTSVSSGYPYAAGWLGIMGAGVGFAMPTAMKLSIGALGKERAGSGSALMSTLRQAAGTIGVAILGTLVATRYAANLGALDRSPIRDSVTAGVAVAEQQHDPVMLEQVRSAFVSGMQVMLWVSAAISAAAVLLALVTTRRPSAPEPGPRHAAESVHGR
ncbi:DHA2 family efflux MFS transporter permease subunit [Nocardia sp. NPDC088792]|uniref:DHA2 family efflux MFS transporter permease subunit n=1 Tax=Nocardia sp. NPDC088792 TaxID=3364332 RepID=UPI0037FFB813